VWSCTQHGDLTLSVHRPAVVVVEVSWPHAFVLHCSAVMQGRADQSCQPGADWAPFLIHVGFKGRDRPVVSARSNFSWCVTRPAQAVAEHVVSDIQSLWTNGQVLSVNSTNGPLLMLVGPQTRPNAGLHPGYFPWQEGELLRYCHWDSWQHSPHAELHMQLRCACSCGHVATLHGGNHYTL
jgi:hypothetical protein